MRIGELLIYEERLNIKPIISTAIQTLDKVFKNNNHEMRIVGGAVRDIALGKSPKDIDFATDATPDEMIAILDKAGISYKPTGLEHGTITAIIDSEPFEITTLRADTETDGRHAEVEFVRSWEEDAKRRDLTYNAMSMDIDGNVYDYFNGMDDLQDKVSKFVGDADERIQEDYLRILRYFRFQGRLSAPNWNEDTLKAISTHAKGLTQISAERIWQEMSKVLAGKNVANVLDRMTKSGVSDVIGLSTNNLNKIQDKGNSIVALAQMDNNVDIAKRWRLSNNEAVLLDFLVKNKNNTLDQKKVEDMIADGIDKEKIQALAELQGQSKMADHAVTVNVPDFPVTGADLIAKGMKPGPEMGATLNQLKQQWKQSNFTATKDELLNEKITKDTPMGDVVKDFYKSDAPQFKGKSKAKKRQMAIAAKLSMDEGRKQITEIPLIPAAVMGAGALWTAYDAYKARKAYKAGEITKDELIKTIGIDAALTVAGGAAAKTAVKIAKPLIKRSQFKVIDGGKKKIVPNRKIDPSGNKVNKVINFKKNTKESIVE